jgi:hypothetical protein
MKKVFVYQVNQMSMIFISLKKPSGRVSKASYFGLPNSPMEILYTYRHVSPKYENRGPWLSSISGSISAFKTK